MDQRNQPLFSELKRLYTSRDAGPQIMRFLIQMTDRIDSAALRRAVDTTMKRYPYYCVRLVDQDHRLYYAPNDKPVVISDYAEGVDLNSEGSNDHLIAFCYSEDWLILDMAHALTDGNGANEVIRTLLYYCSERYHVRFETNGIRLAGDDISLEEWEDPSLGVPDLPAGDKPDMPDMLPAIDPVKAGKLQGACSRTAYTVSLSEEEFMRFNIQKEASPATLVALFLSRAFCALYPDADESIRIGLCVNQRRALKAPLAHHCLVGMAELEYKEKMRKWPLDLQITAYRGMTILQTREEEVLSQVAAANREARMLLSLATDEERANVTGQAVMAGRGHLSATVTYTGKANFGEAERYVCDYHPWTTPVGEDMLVVISAVNGRFLIDFMQNFSSPLYVDAFVKQLEENDIRYERQKPAPMEYPTIRLPWSKTPIAG